MKSLHTAALLLALVPLLGCATGGRGLVLAPVGPSPETVSAPASSNGTLVVYSAFDPNAHFNSLPYSRFYSDYRIYSAEGKWVETVRNVTGTSVSGPKRVALPAGSYRVVARAYGYGQVTVPVVIAANQTTALHLEGRGIEQRELAQAGGSLVRLPGGEVVGYSAPDSLR